MWASWYILYETLQFQLPNLILVWLEQWRFKMILSRCDSLYHI